MSIVQQGEQWRAAEAMGPMETTLYVNLPQAGVLCDLNIGDAGSAIAKHWDLVLGILICNKERQD